MARTKLKRITTRLQAAKRQSPEAEQLSAKYQLASSLVLENRAKIFGNDSGGLRKGFLSSTISDEDLVVGDILFEYDAEYLNFLSTLFTIVIPSSADGSSDNVLPYLSEFQRSNLEVLPSGTPLACSLYPLLSMLMKWSQLPYPQKPQNPAETPSKAKSRKVARRRSTLSSFTMRVNLSVPVIVGCLREREEHMLRESERGGEEGIARTLLPSAVQRGSVSGVSDTRRSSFASSNKHVYFVPHNRATPIPEESSANVDSGKGFTTDLQHDRDDHQQAMPTLEEKFADVNQRDGLDGQCDCKNQQSYTVTQNIVIKGKQHCKAEAGEQKGESPKKEVPRSVVTETKVGSAGLAQNKVEIVHALQEKGLKKREGTRPKERKGAMDGEQSSPESLQHSVPHRDKRGKKKKEGEAVQHCAEDPKAKGLPKEKEGLNKELDEEQSTPKVLRLNMPPGERRGRKEDKARTSTQHSEPRKEKGTRKMEFERKRSTQPEDIQHSEATRDDRAKRELEATVDTKGKKSTQIPDSKQKGRGKEDTLQGAKASLHPKLERKEGRQGEVAEADNKAEKDAVDKKEASGLQLLQVPVGTLKVSVNMGGILIHLQTSLLQYRPNTFQCASVLHSAVSAHCVYGNLCWVCQ